MSINLSDFLKPEHLISASATVIAFMALAVSWRSLAYSKKAYSLAKIDHNEKHQAIAPYLIEAVKWRSPDKEGDTYASFAVSYANKASMPTSFVAIELEVTWYDAEDVTCSAYVQPEVATYPLRREGKLKTLELPLNLLAKETKSGWISYRLPNVRGKQRSIDQYKLVASTVDGMKVTLEAYILPTLAYEDF